MSCFAAPPPPERCARKCYLERAKRDVACDMVRAAAKGAPEFANVEDVLIEHLRSVHGCDEATAAHAAFHSWALAWGPALAAAQMQTQQIATGDQQPATASS